MQVTETVTKNGVEYRKGTTHPNSWGNGRVHYLVLRGTEVSWWDVLCMQGSDGITSFPIKETDIDEEVTCKNCIRRTMPKRSKRAKCKGCSKTKEIKYYRLCSTCLSRWRYHGKPRDEHGQIILPKYRIRWTDKPYRIEDYQDLTQNMGVSDEEAAKRLNVCMRTIHRYKREIRERKLNVGTVLSDCGMPGQGICS